MSKVLVVRHVLRESLGTVADTLGRCSVAYEYVDLAAGAAGPENVNGYSGLVILGGPMSANDPFPYISRELYLIEGAVRAGIPVLGICLGAQLIAKAAGSRIYRNRVPEIGWYPLERTPEGAADALVRHFSETELVFQWHGETFDLPPGAVWLARSQDCEHQAFRLGSNIWGFQFHIEVTPEMIGEWVRADEACGDAREASGPIDPGTNSERLAELSRAAVEEWVRLL